MPASSVVIVLNIVVLLRFNLIVLTPLLVLNHFESVMNGSLLIPISLNINTTKWKLVHLLNFIV